MRDSKLISFEELKQIVITQSIVSKKAPKRKKKLEEPDSYLNMFFN